MIEIRRRPIDVDAVNQSRHSSPRDSLTKSASNYARSFLGSLFPPVDWVRSYKKRYLPGDVISGLTVSMIRLPQVIGLFFRKFENILWKSSIISPSQKSRLWSAGWSCTNKWRLLRILPMLRLLAPLHRTPELDGNVFHHFPNVGQRT